MIGLKRNYVELVPYDKNWGSLFNKEKDFLTENVQFAVVAIEHVGSTAIPGIMAKPLIDIAIGVPSMTDVKKTIAEMEKIGYIWRPGFGQLDRNIVFAKGNDETRTHYIHLMEHGGKEWEDKILFRDFLRNNPKYAKKYEDIKKVSASAFKNDRKAYTAQKDNLVTEILVLARKEKAEK